MPKSIDHDELVRLARLGLIGRADKRAVAQAILDLNKKFQEVEARLAAEKPKRKAKSGDAVSDVE